MINDHCVNAQASCQGAEGADGVFKIARRARQVQGTACKARRRRRRRRRRGKRARRAVSMASLPSSRRLALQPPPPPCHHDADLIALPRRPSGWCDHRGVAKPSPRDLPRVWRNTAGGAQVLTPCWLSPCAIIYVCARARVHVANTFLCATVAVFYTQLVNNQTKSRQHPHHDDNGPRVHPVFVCSHATIGSRARPDISRPEAVQGRWVS